MTQLAESAMAAVAERETVSRAPRRVRLRLAALIASHTFVDIYSAFVPPLVGVLQVRCKLSSSEAAWLVGIGSLTSGLSQPLSAWLNDKFDSRAFGAIGLAIAAVCLSCIGVADSFWTLVPLFALGMIGSGIYHPTGASSMGQLTGQRRSLGISLFHLAGMIGGIAGSILVTRVTALPRGFEILRAVMIPGLLFAVLLHFAIRNMPHRHHGHEQIRFSAAEITRRWRMVWVLFAANAMRFTVNVALVYLFVRWVHEVTAAANPGLDEKTIAAIGAPINGNLNAFLIVGMAIGGLSAGTFIKPGREKWPMVLTALLLAPAVAMFGVVGIQMGYLLAVLSGIGFAGMVPVTISCAQRLLPHRTSLASGLMLGGAWALAILGPRGVELCLMRLELGLARTFTLTACLLAMSGVVCLVLDSKVLREAAGRH